MRAPRLRIPTRQIDAPSSARAPRAPLARFIDVMARASDRVEHSGHGSSRRSRRPSSFSKRRRPPTTAVRRHAFALRQRTRPASRTAVSSPFAARRRRTGTRRFRSLRSALTSVHSSRAKRRFGCAARTSIRRESKRPAREHVQHYEQHDGAHDDATEERQQRGQILVHALSSGSTPRGSSSLKMCARTISVVATIVGSLAGFGIAGLVGVSSCSTIISASSNVDRFM